MMKRRFITCLFVLLSGAGAFDAFAQYIQFTQVPDGYEPGSIVLPANFGGALAAHPADPDILYCSIGTFGDMDVARVQLSTGQVELVAGGPFVAIGGLAVVSDTTLIIVDSGSDNAGPPNDTILLARDLDTDGDFDDAGEVTELIAPILVNPTPSFLGFTGAQCRMAPAGDPQGAPTGSVLVQTADSAGEAELLVIVDPLTAPDYLPSGGAWFSGFDFNGGFDFDSAGRVILGTAGADNRVLALVNLNANDKIDAGEFAAVVTGEGAVADLIVDAEDDVFFCGFNLSFEAVLRSFRVPADPLSETAAPQDFAVTDSGFLSGVMINSKTMPFEPWAADGATLVVSGFQPGFFAPAAENLLTLRPFGPSSATEWTKYR